MVGGGSFFSLGHIGIILNNHVHIVTSPKQNLIDLNCIHDIEKYKKEVLLF